MPAPPQKSVEETKLPLVNADRLDRDFAWSRRALAKLAWRLTTLAEMGAAADVADMVAELDEMQGRDPDAKMPGGW